MNDTDLLRQFEDCSLAFEVWRQHQTHVKMAYVVLRAHPFDVALPRPPG